MQAKISVSSRWLFLNVKTLGNILIDTTNYVHTRDIYAVAYK